MNSIIMLPCKWGQTVLLDLIRSVVANKLSSSQLAILSFSFQISITQGQMCLVKIVVWSVQSYH
jgi:hypothetical protein